MLFRENLLLPTDHWGMDAFDSTLGHVKHTKHWKPSQGPRCVIFGDIIQSRCLSCSGDAQPASEERPLLPTGHWGTVAVLGNWTHWTLKTWGPWCVISGQIIISWYMHYVWWSQPASEEHPITPNWPLRNGFIWQHYRARETHQTLKTISGRLGVKYLTIWFNPGVCLI